MFAQCEIVAADLDLNGVSKWRKADQLNLGSNQKPHLEQTSAVLGGDPDLRNNSGASNCQSCKWLILPAHNYATIRWTGSTQMWSANCE